MRVIVAIKERSAGNESVGDMWLETAIFNEDTPVKEIVEWSKFGHSFISPGKLIITTPTGPQQGG